MNRHLNKLILSETVYVILLNIVIIIDYIIWHIGIKPHNIVIDDHLNLKNYFYLYDLEEEYMNNYYKAIYKNLKLKLIIEKNQYPPCVLIFKKLMDNNTEKGINIYQALNQYLIKDGQIIMGK